jgi:hypothetical protein
MAQAHRSCSPSANGLESFDLHSARLWSRTRYCKESGETDNAQIASNAHCGQQRMLYEVVRRLDLGSHSGTLNLPTREQQYRAVSLATKRQGKIEMMHTS